MNCLWLPTSWRSTLYRITFYLMRTIALRNKDVRR
jgi:hypothetical protein